jgi:GR25 family glycosyltransferase involved in LPS biosynthesis
MNKFNEVFPNVYCINLNRDTQRFENMLKVFNYLDINPTRWVATTPDVFTHLSKSLNLLSPNYLACLTSHLTAIRDAFDKGLETIFIVEDDVIPHKDFHNLFNLFYQEVTEWDFLYLSYIRLTDDCMYWTYSDAENDLISPRVIKANNFWSGMAYGLNRKAMENILTYYNNNKLIEIDRYYVELLQKNEDIKSIGSFPQLIAGLDNYSNNTQIFTEIFTRSANPKYLRREDFLDI